VGGFARREQRTNGFLEHQGPAAASPFHSPQMVNLPQSETDEKMITQAIARNRPIGSESWMCGIVKTLGLEQTLRPRGRPLGWRKKRVRKEEAK
jgi:hypothetical protein